MGGNERVIPQAQAGQAQLWKIPEVGDPPPAPEPEAQVDEETDADAGLMLPTAERIREIEDQAYQAGFERGREAGYEEGLSTGREMGYKDGEAKGVKAAEKTTEQRLKAWDRLLQGLVTPYEELDAVIEEELVQLAIAVARQLVRRELRTDPSAVVAVLREALSVLPSADRKVRLYLHPQDAKLVKDALHLNDLERPWSVVDDPTLSRGGVKLETDTSRVDASLEARLNAVIASVWGGERRSDHIEEDNPTEALVSARAEPAREAEPAPSPAPRVAGSGGENG